MKNKFLNTIVAVSILFKICISQQIQCNMSNTPINPGVTYSSPAFLTKYSRQNTYIPTVNDPILTLKVTVHLFINSDGTNIWTNYTNHDSIRKVFQTIYWPTLRFTNAPLINPTALADQNDRYSYPRTANYNPSNYYPQPTTQYDSRIRYEVTNIYIYENTSLCQNVNMSTNLTTLVNYINTFGTDRLNEGLPIISNLNSSYGYQTWINGRPAVASPLTPYDAPFYNAHLSHEIGHCMGLGHTYYDLNGGGNDWNYFNGMPCNYSNTNDFLSDVFPTNNSFCTNTTNYPPVAPCNVCMEKANYGPQQFLFSNNLMGGNNGNTWMSPLQMGRRYRNLHIIPSFNNNRIREFVKDQISQSSNPWTITQDELWDFDIQLYKDILVKTGNTLRVTGKIAMARLGKIVVEPGAKLILDGGELTTWSKIGRWQGVQLQGNSSLNQNYNFGYAINQGMINIINGGTIKDAEMGIFNGLGTVGQPFFIIGGTTGGVIIADNANFINNVRDVVMASYSFNDKSYFNNCKFRTTGALIGGVLPAEHVNLAAVNNINFTRCNFEYLAGNVFNLNQRRTGIYSMDATFRVDHACNNNVNPCTGGFTRNVFNGLSNGIYIENTNPLKVPTIANTDFNGIINYNTYAMNVNSFIYEKNNINAAGYGSSTGLYLNQCKLYNVRNNVFTQNASVSNQFEVGIVANNSTNGLHQIYRNTFSNLYVGILAMNNNSGSSNGTDGLRMNCNDFTPISNKFDISLTQTPIGGLPPTVMTQQGTSGSGLTVVRNRYGANCTSYWNGSQWIGNEEKWAVQGASVKSYNHPTSNDAASRLDLPSTACKDPLVNVVVNPFPYAAIHCPETQSTGGGGGGGGGSARLLKVNNEIKNLSTNNNGENGRFISTSNTDLQGYYAEKLNYYLTDSIESSKDSVIAILLDPNNPIPDKEELLSYAYLNSGQLAKAIQQISQVSINNPVIANYQRSILKMHQEAQLFTGAEITNGRNSSLNTPEAHQSDEIAGVKVLRKILNGIEYYIPRELPRLEIGSFNPEDNQNTLLYEAYGKSNIMLYPNPSNNTVNYLYNGEFLNDLELFVLDATGRIVHNQKYNNGSLVQISIKGFAVGVYQIVCKSGKTVVNQQKLVKID